MSEQLKHKIHNYEVDPPAAVWKNLASELNNTNDYLPVSKKMFDYEVNPPSSAWINISEALKKGEGIQGVIPARRINPLIFKFGVAAVFIGIIILGSLFLINDNSTPRKQIADNLKNPSGSSKKKHIWLDPSITTATLLNAASAISSLKEAETYANIPDIENDGYVSSRPLHNVPIKASFTVENISIPARPILDSRGEVILYPKIVMSEDGEHIEITAPNGQQTRISSKFINVLLYLNGDQEVPYVNSPVEREIWQKKFDDWRNKIMQNSFIPSSSNFFDIMELKELLTKDNQQ
jgi:hypothetical protein